MKDIPKQQEIVIIDWIDSRHGGGWEFVTHINNDVCLCQSVGWIIYESKDTVMIAPNVDRNKDGLYEQVCGRMSIPRCSITAIRKIGLLKNGNNKL